MRGPSACMPHKRVLGQADWALARHQCQQERRSPAGARASVAAAVRVATLHPEPALASRPRDPRGPLGIKTESAFAVCAFVKKSAVREALALRSASRHPGRSTLPREPCSLRRASGFSHEYLLLSPRSALAHVPARAAPSLRHLLLLKEGAPRPPTHESFLYYRIAPAARHRPLAERPPFSRPPHSASQLLRTA